MSRVGRIEKAPHGRGSAEAWVRQRYVAEIDTYRRNRNRVNTGLIVLIDGDELSPAERRKQLDEAGRSRSVDARHPDERIAIFVCKRNIESWLHCLAGGAANETNSYRHLDRERNCAAEVRSLHLMCREGKLQEPVPDSLADACDEFNGRLSGVL